MASTMVVAWFLAVTMSRCPKRPVMSKMMPSGVAVAGRLVNRDARRDRDDARAGSGLKGQDHAARE